MKYFACFGQNGMELTTLVMVVPSQGTFGTLNVDYNRNGNLYYRK